MFLKLKLLKSYLLIIMTQEKLTLVQKYTIVLDTK